MIDDFFRGDFAAVPTNVPAMVLGLLLAFAGGHVIAWVYMFTHTGLSYSRSFVNSLVVMPIVVAMVMMVLSNNLVTAFGLMAVFAIVRFRNILRDTLDTTYVLGVIVIGMACGTQKFTSAVVAFRGAMAQAPAHANVLESRTELIDLYQSRMIEPAKAQAQA